MFHRIFSRFKSSAFHSRGKKMYSQFKSRAASSRFRNCTIFAATAFWYETLSEVVDKNGKTVPAGTYSNLDKFRNMWQYPRTPEIEAADGLEPDEIPDFDGLFADFEGTPQEPKDPEDPPTYEERPLPKILPKLIYEQLQPLFYYDSYYEGLLSSPQAMLNFNLSQQVEESYHPWYPKDRQKLDMFLRSSSSNLWKSYPRLIPERLPLPWGKPITLLVDCSVFFSKAGTTRPAWRHFLHDVSQIYEIILYGETLKKVREIDSRSKYCSFLLCPQMNRKFEPEMFKNPHCLNRPLDSIVILDTKAEDAFMAPRNTLIIKKWDGRYLNDPALSDTALLLRDIADAQKMGFPVYTIVDKFQNVQLDCAEMYKARQDPDRYVREHGIVEAERG
eukprot:TRINITY_DN24840_c0_g1_i1.p1 TRINITY_DN24840_c0_g1~~TRINITY_DN24840_c0_g1_i1.p1  ORF type:complete len:389 (-),score=66.25 TRINITY_DN24840_c0_g1_i1:28-1194(-)